MEPERKIEKLLREYAKKRRADAGEPSKMHPAMRRILQGEVARRAPKEENSLSLWQLFRQEWAVLIGFALIIFFCASLLLPALSSAKRKAQNITVLNNLKEISLAIQINADSNDGKLPKSLNDLTNELASDKILDDPLTGKRIIYVAGGATLADLSSNSVVAYSPEDKNATARAVLFADGRVALDTPEQFAKDVEVASRRPALVARAENNTTTIEQNSFQLNTSESARGAFAENSSPSSKPVPVATETAGEAASASSPTPVVTVTGALAYNTSTNSARRLGGFGGFGGGGFGGNRPAVGSPPVVSSPVVAPPAAASLAVANEPVGTGALFFRNTAQQNSVAQNSDRVELMNAIRAPNQPVLANFQLQQNGNAIRIVDGDGSVYSGFLLSSDTTEQTVLKAKMAPAGNSPVQAQRQPMMSLNGTSQTAAGNLSFRVIGMNATLRQNVVFAGSLSAISNAPVIENNSNALAEAPEQSVVQQQQLLLSNVRVTGTATIGTTNQVNVNAIPVTQ
ncbi:MAG: hypothetical protein ACLQSR_03405 [Limisphaerales bacterium]